MIEGGHKFVDNNLIAFFADASGKLYVLWLESHTLGMYRAQVCIFEEMHQVIFSSVLQGRHGMLLHPKIGVMISNKLSHQALEGQLLQ